MNLLLKTLGYPLTIFYRIYARYQTCRINEIIGGGNRRIAYPYRIAGEENIIAEAPINIGPNSLLFTTRAKLIIKQHFVSGPGLTVITGDHHFIVGRFLDTITDEEKIPENDKDVIIEEDVWCGANVTILKGVTIGRGAIIAAGSVVTRDVPPYSIAGGIPARVLKYKFTEEQIKEHEKVLYNKK